MGVATGFKTATGERLWAGAIADGQFLKREGASIVGATATPGGYTDEEAQDAVGAMADQSSLAYTDATPLLAVKVQMSIAKDTVGLQLVSDAANPGANQVYGTNGAGAKGWKADPAAGGLTHPQIMARAG
jgi:hypothetical protein